MGQRLTSTLQLDIMQLFSKTRNLLGTEISKGRCTTEVTDSLGEWKCLWLEGTKCSVDPCSIVTPQEAQAHEYTGVEDHKK